MVSGSCSALGRLCEYYARTVSGGTSAVEKMHRAISKTTFSLVDHFSKDSAFQQSAHKARQTHDQASKHVYHAVRTTNKAIHILADTLFITKAEKRVMLKRGAREKPSEKDS